MFIVHLCIVWNKAQILKLSHLLLEQGNPYNFFCSQYAEIQTHFMQVKSKSSILTVTVPFTILVIAFYYF